MPTATLSQTQQYAHRKQYSLPLTGGVTPDNNEVVLPLEPSGALDLLPGAAVSDRTRLTPALGVQFDKRLQLKDVLNMQDKKKRRAIMNDLAYESEYTSVSARASTRGSPGMRAARPCPLETRTGFAGARASERACGVCLGL